MRIAALPCVTHRHSLTESEIVQFVKLARTAWKQRKAVTYLVIPDDMNDLDKLEDEPGLYYIKIGKWLKFHDAMAVIPEGFYRMFAPRWPELYADVVITARTSIAGALQRMLWKRKDFFMPVIIGEEMAADYSTPMVVGIDDIDLLSRSYGYAMCRTFFSTELERKVAIRACRRFLTMSLCRKIEKRSWILPRGIDFAVIDRVRKKVRGKNATFTLFFGGRLNRMKRAQQLVWTYDKFFSAGRQVRIVLTSPIVGWNIGQAFPPELEILPDMKTEEFLEECFKAHVLLASSRIEGFTVGLLEQMATGIVTILPDLEWAKVLMKDKWDSYPFKYKTFHEAYGWLKWIYEHYDEAVNKVTWVPDWLRDTYSEEACKLKMHDMVFSYVYENHWPPPTLGKKNSPNRNTELVDDYVKKMDEFFTIDDLIRAIVAGKDNTYRPSDFSNPIRGKMTAWDLYSYLSFSDMVEDTGKKEVEFHRLK